MDSVTFRHATIVIPKGTRYYEVVGGAPKKAYADMTVSAKIVTDVDGRVYKGPKSLHVGKEWLFTEGHRLHRVNAAEVREVLKEK